MTTPEQTLAAWLDAGKVDCIRLRRTYPIPGNPATPTWIAIAESGPDDEEEGTGDNVPDALHALYESLVRYCGECSAEVPSEGPDFRGGVHVRTQCERCDRDERHLEILETRGRSV